ncbi:MAG: OmpA family protein [Lachnospiraceae bacterium]|nr:OmpA family protein [Lachnospiraceae bacterium]
MKKQKNRQEEETSYWLSYSDMMAALLLIFILIISFTLLQSQKRYEEKENELLAQQQLVEEQQKQLEEQQEELDKLIGIRTELIEALKEEFEGTDLSVNVDPKTGSIALDSSILFDSGQFALKTSGEELLRKFLPKYIGVLTDKQFNDYISEIIIEGHTDTQGDYLYNLELSQKRALSVSTFCLDTNKEVLSQSKIEKLRKIVTANGKSFSNPVLDDNGNEDQNASRRVEFLFRLKDEEMISDMSDILNG